MSGHNKWSQIKRKKEAVDQKKSREFAQMAREIKTAARHGGEDSSSNTALRSAIERARAANMPKANIERAIARGAGRGAGGRLEGVVYEGYGPGGAALLIHTETDNRNRTVSEIKHILQTHQGSLAGVGGVAWMFKDGKVSVPLTLEEKEVTQLRALVQELEEHEDVEQVVTNSENI